MEFEYTAISEMFDEVSEYEDPKEYHIETEYNLGESSWTFKKGRK